MKTTPLSSYTEVYTTYFPRLVRFSQTYLLSREEAENIVQDVFLYLWEHPETQESIRHTQAFLFTMVKNRCIDYLRQQTQEQNKRRPLTELQEKELQLKLYSLQQFASEGLFRTDTEALLQKVIDDLPPRCREIFLLSRLDGLHHKEIAERLHISTNTVEGQVAIALHKLRMALQDYFVWGLILLKMLKS